MKGVAHGSEVVFEDGHLVNEILTRVKDKDGSALIEAPLSQGENQAVETLDIEHFRGKFILKISPAHVKSGGED